MSFVHFANASSCYFTLYPFESEYGILSSELLNLTSYCIFLVLNKTIFSKQCCCSITEVLIPGNTSMYSRFSCKLSDRMVSNLITVLATVKVCSVFFVHVFAVFGMQSACVKQMMLLSTGT